MKNKILFIYSSKFDIDNLKNHFDITFEGILQNEYAFIKYLNIDELNSIKDLTLEDMMSYRIIFCIDKNTLDDIKYLNLFSKYKLIIYKNNIENDILNEFIHINDVKTYNNINELKDDILNIFKEKENIFFTSDTHFNQQRTLELSKRPFKDVEHMNRELISRFNSAVRSKDKIYHLGDFGDINYLDKLTIGDKKLTFLFGNYDYNMQEFYKLEKSKKLNKIYYNPIIVKIDNINFQLTHEPISPNGIKFDKYASDFVLFGHIHGRQFCKYDGLDVGVDAHNFFPIDIKIIKFYMNAILNHYDENVFISILKK